MKYPSTLEELIEALRCLPGVGPKSAQRMAYHLLQRDHAGAGRLATAAPAATMRHPRTSGRESNAFAFRLRQKAIGVLAK